VDTASIPAATTEGKATIEALRAEMYRARDELRDAGHRPPKRLITEFAEARDRYWRRLRGDAA